MKPDPRQNRLKTHLRDHPIHATPWAGLAFRAAALKHASPETLIDGKGAHKHGGRWNPPASFRAVYLALSPEAAVAEVFQTGSHYGFNVASLRPRVIVAVRIQLWNIVDLRPDAGPISEVCSLAELLGENWRIAADQKRMTLSQTLGSLFFAIGIEGFLVPSATGEGPGNLVLFNDNLLPDSSLEVLGGDELDQALRGPDHD